MLAPESISISKEPTVVDAINFDNVPVNVGMISTESPKADSKLDVAVHAVEVDNLLDKYLSPDILLLPE